METLKVFLEFVHFIVRLMTELETRQSICFRIKMSFARLLLASVVINLGFFFWVMALDRGYFKTAGALFFAGLVVGPTPSIPPFVPRTMTKIVALWVAICLAYMGLIDLLFGTRPTSEALDIIVCLPAGVSIGAFLVDEYWPPLLTLFPGHSWLTIASAAIWIARLFLLNWNAYASLLPLNFTAIFLPIFIGGSRAVARP